MPPGKLGGGGGAPGCELKWGCGCGFRGKKLLGGGGGGAPPLLFNM